MLPIRLFVIAVGILADFAASQWIADALMYSLWIVGVLACTFFALWSLWERERRRRQEEQKEENESCQH